MIIYYNPAYSASPYRNNAKDVEFGNIYCGDIQLLQKLLFYTGIPYLPASQEERVAYYHVNMQSKLKKDSLFYNSFKIDSLGMTQSVLMWRDALVEVGWNVRSYVGRSIKLSLIHDIEPDDMLYGEADYWYKLIQIASERRILPETIAVIVTCNEQEVRPHIAYILSKQKDMGVSIEYRINKNVCADGNLGKIQKAILDKSEKKVVLKNDDNTLHYISFVNEDDALRYVATEPINKSAVYFCSKPKRLDNTLRLLGKPTIGSSMRSKSSQVIQLFLLGNGLFEYPLNMHRIIEWLNLPISPIKGVLRRKLCNALINSGGINNEEWNVAKDDYLKSVEDEKERKKIEENLKVFLPIPQTEIVDVEKVKLFNNDLRKWATKLLSMENFPYDDIVREQIAMVECYCSALIKILDNVSSEFNFLDLQLWCKNIVQLGTYNLYDAKVNSHTTIESIGDIHDIADNIIWLLAEDSGFRAYPFEMLNSDEYDEVMRGGAMLYNREQHSLINQAIMLRILFNTKHLTIIEADKSKSEKVARHPFVLQLNERIEGGLKTIKQIVVLSDECMEKDSQVINLNKTPTLIQLGEEVAIKERHERETEAKKQAESYSSLNELIQHPFTYVCEKCAKLKDQVMPSAQDVERTLGNVAHLIIEKVFSSKSIEMAREYYNAEYDFIFEESVNEKGLLLRQSEYTIDLNRLKTKMKVALDKLAKVIENNALIVEACEYEFNLANWKEAGPEVKLASRADMLLKDSKGGKVIFDFKYSHSKSRKSEIEENRALQLEVYRYMAKQEFGEKTPVRVAYVLLPDVTILTADKFDEVDTIQLKRERANANVIVEAANSYQFRWEQLKDGKIERVEGCPISTGEYGMEEANKGLFPLSVYKNKYSEDKFDKGYKNLK